MIVNVHVFIQIQSYWAIVINSLNLHIVNLITENWNT